MVQNYEGFFKQQIGMDLHAGGKTSLELKGYAHYLPAGQRTLFLYGRPGLAKSGSQGVCVPARNKTAIKKSSTFV